MDTRETRDLPARLEALRRRFERSRRTRKPRTPIPDPLWAAAVKLVGRYGLCRIARTLRVDYYSLKKRVEAASAAEHGRPTPTNALRRCPVGSRAVFAAGAEDGTRATFVELPPPAHTAFSECILELENREGAKMRVQLKGVAMPDLTALSRSFWDRGP
jgi:hypothetical protein